MSWKWDVLSYICFSIAYFIAMHRLDIKLLKMKFQTAQGFVLSGKELVRISEAASKKMLSIEEILFGWVAFSFIGLIVYAIGKVIEHVFDLSWISSSIMGLAMVCSGILFWIGWKSSKSELEQDAMKLLLETPEAFQGYGKYIRSPDKFEQVLGNLKSIQNRLEKRQHDLELVEIELKHYKSEKQLKKYGNALVRKTRIKGDVKDYSQQILMLNKKIEHLLTDEMPEDTAHILKKKEEIREEQVKLIPHHLQVLRKIANDESLPEEMREDARKTLSEQSDKEQENLERKRIGDARIELDVAKRML